jgi:hypothetical protein
MNQSGESLSSQEAPTSSGGAQGASGTTTSTSAEISYAELDLFTLGRRACEIRAQLTSGRGTFVRSRQLLATGAWRGPKDAAESYVDEADLPALGGWEAARKEGVRTLVGGHSLALHREVVTQGGRSVWRVFFAAERAAARENAQLFGPLQEALRQGFRPFGLLPTPEGEALGLPSLRVFAELRVAFPDVPHLFAEVALLGPRLAQMALGFGADALFAPIVSERALRLGDNAKNPAMTRKEAATLLRGAGLVPCERRSDGTLEEVES